MAASSWLYYCWRGIGCCWLFAWAWAHVLRRARTPLCPRNWARLAVRLGLGARVATRLDSLVSVAHVLRRARTPLCPCLGLQHRPLEGLGGSSAQQRCYNQYCPLNWKVPTCHRDIPRNFAAFAQSTDSVAAPELAAAMSQSDAFYVPQTSSRSAVFAAPSQGHQFCRADPIE